MAETAVAKKDTFSVALSSDLESHKGALPANFNVERFVQNSVALLNGNDVLANFARQYGTAQIKQGLLRAAYQDLDALNAEVYLIPYGSQLQFMPSFKGMTKMAKRYSTRKVKDIYSKVVRDGDTFEETIVNGQPSINFTAKPFNNGEAIGVFAVCLFEDGGMLYETMSKDEVEKCRKSSKAQNSPAWKNFWSEMARKTVMRRLCKSITLNMDSEAQKMFNAGTEIETDPAELAAEEIRENANNDELVFDVEGEAE